MMNNRVASRYNTDAAELRILMCKALADAINELLTVYRNNRLENQPAPVVNLRRSHCNFTYVFLRDMLKLTPDTLDGEMFYYAFQDLYQAVFDNLWEDLWIFSGSNDSARDEFSGIVINVAPVGKDFDTFKEFNEIKLTVSSL